MLSLSGSNCAFLTVYSRGPECRLQLGGRVHLLYVLAIRFSCKMQILIDCVLARTRYFSGQRGIAMILKEPTFSRQMEIDQANEEGSECCAEN